MVALSLWKVVCCRDFFTLMDGRLVLIGDSSLFGFITPMHGSLVIMGDSLLLRFCYSNGW